jgi:hypothetical protein
MTRVPRANHRFHAAVARAEHEIESIEVELFDGRREEWQVVAIEPFDEGKPLDE